MPGSKKSRRLPALHHLVAALAVAAGFAAVAGVALPSVGEATPGAPVARTGTASSGTTSMTGPAGAGSPAGPAAGAAAGPAHLGRLAASAVVSAPPSDVDLLPQEGAGERRSGSVPLSISRLDPQFRHRLELATRAATRAGVRVQVRSGWRSAAQQEGLIQRYTRIVGSRQAAYRWALPAEKSMHVRGLAVDISQGAAWLRAHGATYGLCRRYRSEPWHFEMLTRPGGHCPALEDHPIA